MDHKEEKAARLAKRLEALRCAYVLKFPEKCEQIDSLFQSYLKSKDFDELEKLRQATHKLKGSGATYGFDEISECAMCVEVRLAAAIKVGGPLHQETLSFLHREIDQLKDAMMRAAVDVGL